MLKKLYKLIQIIFYIKRRDLGIKEHVMLGMCFGSGERRAGQEMEVRGPEVGGILWEGNGMSEGQRCSNSK